MCSSDLAEFTRFMPAGFSALTGSATEIRATADAWGVKYARVETGSKDGYSMSHTADVFLVDANGGMTVESALRMLRLLPPGLDFVLEAPCATWREIVSLRRRSTVPIIWDELADSDNAIANLVAEDAAEGIGLKISKNGGLTRGRRQRDM